MMIITPLASAQNNTIDVNVKEHLNIHLENKNATNVIGYDQTSKANLSSLNIQKPEELQIPSNVNKFDVVTFDHPSLNDQLKSGKGFIISFGGKDYETELHPVKFENTSDGVYSYYGTLLGANSSKILITTSKNVLIGDISLGNETFWIIPVEPRARTEISQSPLHIIYSSKNVMNVTFIIDNQSVTTNGAKYPENLETISNLQSTPPDQWVFVDVLVVTDQQFVNTEPNWLSSAHYIIANVNSNFSRSDINVAILARYDDNAYRRNQFYRTTTSTEALNLFMNVYPTTILDSYSTLYPPDIALYLGGYDIIGDTSQGATWGYSNSPDQSRYAWVQMVPDADDIVGGINWGYTGSP